MAVVGDPRGFYGLLGVGRGASAEEIRAAFRERAKLYHPDGGGGGGRADEERFHRLREAYEVLRDPHRRLEYDVEGMDAERHRDRAVREGAQDAAPGQAAGPRRTSGWATANRFAAGASRIMSPSRLLAAAAAAVLLLLLLLTLAILLVVERREAARLRVELDRTATELAAAAARPGNGDAPPAAYEAGVTFPDGSGALDAEARSQLSVRAAELQAVASTLPAGGGWQVVVDGRAPRAVGASGVAVDAWELALLRVAAVAEFLVGAGVPPDRIAIRFLAGTGPAAFLPTPSAGPEEQTVALTLLRGG